MQANIGKTTLSPGTYYMYATVGATTNYNGATTAVKQFNVIPNGGLIESDPIGYEFASGIEYTDDYGAVWIIYYESDDQVNTLMLKSYANASKICIPCGDNYVIQVSNGLWYEVSLAWGSGSYVDLSASGKTLYVDSDCDSDYINGAYGNIVEYDNIWGRGSVSSKAISYEEANNIYYTDSYRVTWKITYDENKDCNNISYYCRNSTSSKIYIPCGSMHTIQADDRRWYKVALVWGGLGYDSRVNLGTSLSSETIYVDRDCEKSDIFGSYKSITWLDTSSYEW